ncbi:MAG: hypothetical protein QNI92_03295 [Desulfobacterales bacterium]|nr:hypothetical protein [Desulfobacterales bacterium]
MRFFCLDIHIDYVPITIKGKVKQCLKDPIRERGMLRALLIYKNKYNCSLEEAKFAVNIIKENMNHQKTPHP